MRASTVARASGLELMLLGGEPLQNALRAATNRLQRVTGWKGRDFKMTYEPLPRTGDDIKIKVIWSR